MEKERMLGGADHAASTKRASANADVKGIANLAMCFVGLQASYLTWGIMQEKIMTTQVAHRTSHNAHTPPHARASASGGAVTSQS